MRGRGRRLKTAGPWGASWRANWSGGEHFDHPRSEPHRGLHPITLQDFFHPLGFLVISGPQSVKKIVSPILLLCLLLVGAVLARAEEPKGHRFILYAQFLEDTKVTLTDGSEWAMDKGDCFPIDMFKDQQTKVVLKLGSATFTTSRDRVRVLDEKENDAGLRSYRVTLNSYLKSRGEEWKKDNAKGPTTPVPVAKAVPAGKGTPAPRQSKP